MSNMKRIKGFLMTAALLLMGSGAFAQSQPSPAVDCGEYQWPEITAPCPEVQIKQKHDHTPNLRYRREGWDTAVTCPVTQLVLSCMPYIPVSKFNGTYYVDQITYNPPDTTFALGTRMPPMADDNFAPSVTNIPYPFYFFGIRKTSFILGANGCVSFSPSATGSSSCAWSYSAAIPWTDQTTGAPSNLASMRDAIYGIYEDTDPSVTTGHYETDWGMYYGIQDVYPCRKIICSWKDMSQFSCNDLHCSYQIVCYEGSNIIEVHVKQREVCSGWNGGRGIIGIQNATGQPQVASSNPSDPNSASAINGKPAAFFPSGYNFFTTSMNTTAFRFTPAGTTPGVFDHWYRIFDDGRDSIDLKNANTDPSAYTDTNGYYIPRGSASSSCPNLTKAYVSPTVTSRYVYHLRFRDANNQKYDLYDTITVGVDRYDSLTITRANGDGHELNVCQNELANMKLSMTAIQDTARTEWQISRILDGDTIDFGDSLSRALITLGQMTESDSSKTMTVTIDTRQIPNPPVNKIDTLLIQCSGDFTNGCHNYDIMMLRVFPNFDTTTTATICRNDSYHWSANNRDYYESTDPRTEVVHRQSAPGCDSLCRLHLTVLDVSYKVDHIEDCKPITWHGRTFTESNTATALTDTIVLQNIYGCDSVVQLEFIMRPLTAQILSDVDHFTLDNLDATLTDISIGGDSRVWKFPNGADQTGPVAYYSIPAELDGANIILIENSEYGCVDTATLYIPLNKEHFWVPNAFTPDNPAGNNLFASVSTKTLRQEMIIYNRRGEMVYHCEGVDCAWDGRDLNGNPCVQGAYVYVIRYTKEFEPDLTKVVTGSVTLIR